MNNNIIVKTAIRNWKFEYTRLRNVLHKISNEQLLNEVAPGKNTGIYLLGHLAATTDAMRPLLNLGNKLYPQLEGIFVITPDKSGQDMPSSDELIHIWEAIMDTINTDLERLPLEEWFNRHNSISEEDFDKEPHRNNLSVLLSRTIHQAYHAGQMSLLINRN